MCITDYPITSMFSTPSGEVYPVYEPQQIDDLQWSDLVTAAAREFFKESTGRDPVDSQEAITYQREYLRGV